MSAIGVREKRQPPTPMWSPSLTRPTASSRLVSFSAADLALASVAPARGDEVVLGRVQVRISHFG